MKRQYLLALMLPFVLLNMLVGCMNLAQAPSIDPSVLPEDWHSQTQVLLNEPALTMWWRQFEDAQLEALVHRAFEANSSLQAAHARLRQAHNLGQAQSTVRWPSLDLTAAVSRSRRANNFNRERLQTDSSLGLDGAWALDIFGRNDLIVANAEQSVAIAKAQARAVVLATLRAVVTSYYQLRGIQQRLAMTQRNTELLQKTVKLIEVRYLAGEASEFDFVRARGEYELSFSRIPQFKAQMREVQYRLSVLTHQNPRALDQLLEQPSTLPELPAQVHADLPIKLLQRRPDVMVAQLQTDQALITYDLSVVDLYPTFTLQASTGFGADRLGDLLSLPSRSWSLGAFLNWQIFSIRTKKFLAHADYALAQARLIEYEGAALAALSEVQSAFENYDAALESQSRLNAVVRSREQAREMALSLFDAGESSFLDALDAERELVASRDSLVVSRVNAVASLINLYASLGGGWEAHPTLGEVVETASP